MPRGKFDRRIVAAPPEEETARKYLLWFPDRELFQTPDVFPRIDPPHLFGNDAPLHLEVGCGTGEYLCALARNRPGENFVGVEISSRAVYKAVGTAAAYSPANLRFLRADFTLMYPLLVPASLRAVYLHFPDPDMRSKFRKRRIFSETFLRHVHEALVPGGVLSVMTDVEEFFREMLALIEQDSGFARTHEARYLVGFESEARSRFQHIWETRGLNTLRFEVRKR